MGKLEAVGVLNYPGKYFLYYHTDKHGRHCVAILVSHVEHKLAE